MRGTEWEWIAVKNLWLLLTAVYSVLMCVFWSRVVPSIISEPVMGCQNIMKSMHNEVHPRVTVD